MLILQKNRIFELRSLSRLGNTNLFDFKMGKIATIGTFDGVHIGHLTVIRTLKDYASKCGLNPVVFTFSNHPLSVIKPQKAPACLLSAEEKYNMLRKEDVEVIMTDFTKDMASLSASQWLRHLRDKYDVKAIVLGYDNTFGSDGRHLSREDYAALGKELDIDIIPAQEIDGISSSKIRKLISEGNLKEAQFLSGKPFSISGKIIKGNQLGRTIAFPTANLLPYNPCQILPPFGAYASEIEIKGIGKFRGVTNIGLRPSIDKSLQTSSPSIETFIINFDKDIYGKEAKLTLLDFLRPEKKFGSLEDLKSQIKCDVKNSLEVPLPK